MRAGHQEAIVADRRGADAVLGPGVYRHALADLATRADLKSGRPAAVVHRLRRRAERGERVDRRTRPDRSMSGNMHLCDQLAAIANRNTRADHAIRADFDIGPDDRAWRDPRG